MKKRNVFVKVLVAAVAAVLLLGGCGDPQEVSAKKLSSAFEKELGNPPDPVTICKAFGEFGLSETDRTGGDNVWLSGAYKAKVTVGEYPIPYEKYIVDNLGDRKSCYYGSYVLSKDENAAGLMLENYGENLEKSGWTKIDRSEYGVTDDDTYFKECQLFVKGNNAVVIQGVIGPIHWEGDKVLEKTTEDYFGTCIYFY